MPLYEYQCARCGSRFERIEKVSGPHMRKCHSCNGKVERVLAPSAIRFKGSGWYVTDYARKGAAAADSKASDSAKSEKPEKEVKEAAPGIESKKSNKQE